MRIDRLPPVLGRRLPQRQGRAARTRATHAAALAPSTCSSPTLRRPTRQSVARSAGARVAVRAQIKHLAAFIKASRDPVVPAMLFGDFNVDCFRPPRPVRRILVSEHSGAPADLERRCPARTGRAAVPPATSESRRLASISSFLTPGTRPAGGRRPGERFGGHGRARLDYLFSVPRRALHAQRRGPGTAWSIEQWAPGRDMSDHYGDRGIRSTSRRFSSCRAEAADRVGGGSACVEFTVPADDQRPRRRRGGVHADREAGPGDWPRH